MAIEHDKAASGMEHAAAIEIKSCVRRCVTAMISDLLYNTLQRGMNYDMQCFPMVPMLF